MIPPSRVRRHGDRAQQTTAPSQKLDPLAQHLVRGEPLVDAGATYGRVWNPARGNGDNVCLLTSTAGLQYHDIPLANSLTLPVAVTHLLPWYGRFHERGALSTTSVVWLVWLRVEVVEFILACLIQGFCWFAGVAQRVEVRPQFPATRGSQALEICWLMQLDSDWEGLGPFLAGVVPVLWHVKGR